MKTIHYSPLSGESKNFELQTNSENQIISIGNPRDQHHMDWIKPGAVWGKVHCKYDLDVKVTRRFTDAGDLEETMVFTNNTSFDIYTLSDGIGIYTPFPDYYTKASIGLTKCCNAHIWCGNTSSYIMGLRQGGEAPNLGLIVQHGGIKSYSIERGYDFKGREEEVSNNRGLIILHPDNFILHPGESYDLVWKLTWFQDKADFQSRLLNTQDYIHVSSPAFVTIGNEPIQFQAQFGGNLPENPPIILCNGERAEYEIQGSAVSVKYPVIQPGEYTFTITWGGAKTEAKFLATLPLSRIAKSRVNFIVNKQQCIDPKGHLNGAYLIYDNEEKAQYYSHLNDHNGGRERVGMGALIALYLQTHPDKKLHASLSKYVDYVTRELFNPDDGTVYNDVQRNNDQPRLYNYPWIGILFLEMYKLEKDSQYLNWYFKLMVHFYSLGGDKFYPIGLPMRESIKTFRQAGQTDLADKLLKMYKRHADFIEETGQNYPESEVAYEQSIVAPAARYLSDMYLMTDEEKYQKGAQLQLMGLDLFEGFQPDYHMNEVAIRHWDGYWFGKRRMLGDTFPHYWTTLSGLAFYDSELVIGTDQYTHKAQKSFRSILSLFRKDGSASNAMIYPMTVNGEVAHFYDPWANDQDWGLYYILKHNEF